MLDELLEVEAATKLVDDLSDSSILHTQLDQGPGCLITTQRAMTSGSFCWLWHLSVLLLFSILEASIYSNSQLGGLYAKLREQRPRSGKV